MSSIVVDKTASQNPMLEIHSEVVMQKFSIRMILEKQSDGELLEGFTRVIERDRRRKSHFLAYLNEVDRRRLYASEGYSSLFRFLTERYHLSESSALKRIQAARLVRKFPFLHREIIEGRFSLTALGRLAPFLTGANISRLLTACEGKSVREIESILVKEFPKADVEERLKKSVNALGEDRFHVQFTGNAGLVANLEKAKALLSHRYPQGRTADVIGLALQEMVERLEKPARKSPSKREHGSLRGAEAGTESGAPTNGPAATTMDIARTPPPPTSRSRYIPRGIRSDVRAGARCQHVRPDGQPCGETHFLEIDHRTPFAAGGTHQRENLRLLCWAHNQLAAEVYFGRRWKKSEQKTQKGGGAPAHSPGNAHTSPTQRP